MSYLSRHLMFNQLIRLKECKITKKIEIRVADDKNFSFRYNVYYKMSSYSTITRCDKKQQKTTNLFLNYKLTAKIAQTILKFTPRIISQNKLGHIINFPPTSWTTATSWSILCPTANYF